MKLLWCFILFISFNGISQQDTIINGDTLKYRIYYGVDVRTSGFCDSCIVEEGGMHDGLKQGPWKKYYPNGSLRLIGDYVNDLPDGNYILFYENGNIKEKGTNLMRRYRGELLRYYESGCLKYKGNFRDNGREHGTQTHYYDNCDTLAGHGQIKYVFKANNGVPAVGTAYRYYPNGDVKEEIVYKENGQIKSKESFAPVNALDEHTNEE